MKFNRHACRKQVRCERDALVTQRVEFHNGYVRWREIGEIGCPRRGGIGRHVISTRHALAEVRRPTSHRLSPVPDRGVHEDSHRPAGQAIVEFRGREILKCDPRSAVIATLQRDGRAQPGPSADAVNRDSISVYPQPSALLDIQRKPAWTSLNCPGKVVSGASL